MNSTLRNFFSAASSSAQHSTLKVNAGEAVFRIQFHQPIHERRSATNVQHLNAAASRSARPGTAARCVIPATTERTGHYPPPSQHETGEILHRVRATVFEAFDDVVFNAPGD
jgi:hypothetical protein